MSSAEPLTEPLTAFVTEHRAATNGQRPAVSAPRRSGLPIVAACLGIFTAYVPMTLVAVALGAIGQDLAANTSDLQWVLDAFILPMAALILPAGVLADRVGRKKVLLIGLALMAVNGVVALTASTVGQLWVAQVIGGVGAAALLPSTLAVIGAAIPDPRRRGAAIGAWASSLGLGLALGPFVAGVLLSSVGWRWIFLPLLPLIAVGMIVAAIGITESKEASARRLDVPGLLAATIAIVGPVLAVIEGPVLGWSSPLVVISFCLAVAGLVGFVLIERVSDRPLLPLGLFRSAAFATTSVVAALVMFGLVGTLFVLSMFFGIVQHLDALQIAYRFVFVFGAIVVVGPLIGPVQHRTGPRPLLVIGLTASGSALLSVMTMGADAGLLDVAWRFLVLGGGFGLVLSPMTAAAIAAAPPGLTGMAGAANNAFRQTGGALGPAVLGAILASSVSGALPQALADAGIPAELRRKVLDLVAENGTSAVALLPPGPDKPRVLRVFQLTVTDAVHTTSLVAGLALLAAAVLTLVALRSRAPKPVVETARHSRDTVRPAETNGAVSTGPALFGQVRPRTGRGTVPGVALTLVDMAGRQVSHVIAGADGRYRLAVRNAGRYVLIAAAEGHRPFAAAIMVGERAQTQDVVLAGICSLGGIVHLGDPNRTVPGATVTLTDSTGIVVASEPTDDNGFYRFTDLCEGTYTVTAVAGHYGLTANTAELGRRQQLRCDIALVSDSGRLTGTVRAGQNLLPLADARLKLADSDGNVVRVTATDGNGRYAFGDFPPGRYKLTAHSYQPTSMDIILPSPPGVSHDIEMQHPHLEIHRTMETKR